MEMSLEAVRKNLEYLEHYGTKGMHWGIRRTPEQLGHILKKKNTRYYGRYNKAVKKISKIQGEKTIDQLTAKERAKIQKAIGSAEKQLSKMTSTEEKYGKKIQKAETKQAKAEEKAATKEAAEKEKIEAKKTKLLEKQDWQAIMDNKKLFTERELSDVANRINTEKRLKEALEGPNKMDKLAEKVKSAANLAGAGVDLYNKVQGITNIVNEGKKEKAYKEIRQLMADGKNAEIIKKSINIGDKDIEVFDKRRKFLNELRKGIPKPTPTPTPTPGPGPGPGSGSGNRGGSLSGTVEGVGRNSGRAHGIRGQKWEEIIDVPYEEVKESKLIEQKDKYLPLVLNDIGDFKLSDLKK